MRTPWILRRLAVRMIGQGPVRVGRAAESATLLSELPAEEFSAPEPELVTEDLPSDAARWPRRTLIAPAPMVYRAASARLYDDDGVIYCSKGRAAFRETLNYWDIPLEKNPALGLPRVHPLRVLPGPNVFVGGLGGQTFYHFLVDQLPKLSLLRPALDQGARLILQAHGEQTKLAWLRHLGVHNEVEWLRPLDHFHCESLVFAPPINLAARPTPWALRQLRTLFPPPPPRSPRSRFIWADRRSASARATDWESNLLHALPSCWEVVDFSRLTPAETIQTMSECIAFAGFHGAAFANLALAPEGVRVLEVFRAPNRVWYPTLSELAGHAHSVVFAPGPIHIDRVLSALEALRK